MKLNPTKKGVELGNILEKDEGSIQGKTTSLQVTAVMVDYSAGFDCKDGNLNHSQYLLHMC
jgi:hypothetical protein